MTADTVAAAINFNLVCFVHIYFQKLDYRYFQKQENHLRASKLTCSKVMFIILFRIFL